jgi:DNA-3-methyladenine glycosylase I
MPDVQPRRCPWVNVDHALMREYHDREWGVPVHDDRTHFEFLVLEAAQAGLSWSIILKKREGYRRAFSQFDPEKVARYSQARIDKLTADPGIVRNRLKITSAVKNARAFLAVQEEFDGFDAYCWRFVDGWPRQNRRRSLRGIPPTTPESDAFSRDLKRRGFSFVGSTVIYAHMQAFGMVNDYVINCFRYRDVYRLGAARADLGVMETSSCKQPSRNARVPRRLCER